MLYESPVCVIYNSFDAVCASDSSGAGGGIGNGGSIGGSGGIDLPMIPG